MTLSRKSSRIYMDELDVCGLISVLERRAEHEDDDIRWGIYKGAARVLQLIRDHEVIANQADFMTIFEAPMKGFKDE